MKGCHASIPWIHDITSPRERDQTNQKPPRVHHMDPMAHKYAQNTSNHKGSPASHHEKTEHERGHLGFGQTLGSAEPPLAPFAICFHMVLSEGLSEGARGVLALVFEPVNRRRGSKKGTHT
jgi:hypothetical protein